MLYTFYRRAYSPRVSLPSVCLVLMTRFPQCGRVKTRLQPALTPQQSADVHRILLRHMARRLDGLDPAELVICFDPPDAGPNMRDLLSDVCSATYLAQSPGDLGARIAAAAKVVGELHRRIVFITVDSPDVPLDHLERAAELTERVAVSLGPTEDGGYWSLGLWNEIDAGALLNGIAWSTDRVARQTLQHAEALGYSTATAPAWDDVDRPDDLRRLGSRLKQSRDLEHQRLHDALASCVPVEWLT